MARDGLLQGKRCLVTGASGGIGAATCRAMAREGARGVAVQYLRARDKADALAEELRSVPGPHDGGAACDAFSVRADLVRREDCEALVRTCVARWGGLDAVACLAGHPWRGDAWFAEVEALPDEAFEAAFRVDVLGSLHAAQAALPALRAAGGGALLLTSSAPALTGDVEGISYLVAKAGVAALARSLARTWGHHGIRVNALAPGSVATEAMRGLTPAQEAALASETALRRVARAEELAEVAVFLCSDATAFLTGSVVAVDGGLSYH